jgi:hypothetical protein
LLSQKLYEFPNTMPPNDGLQLRRAISIQAEGKKLLEKHPIAPSAARLCYAAGEEDDSTKFKAFKIA